jgi:hypothetical protein
MKKINGILIREYRGFEEMEVNIEPLGPRTEQSTSSERPAARPAYRAISNHRGRAAVLYSPFNHLFHTKVTVCAIRIAVTPCPRKGSKAPSALICVLQIQTPLDQSSYGISAQPNWDRACQPEIQQAVHSNVR